MPRYICRQCWKEHGRITIVHEGKLPYHHGHVHCDVCDEYDTYYSPGEELRKIEKLRSDLRRHESMHQTANAALYEWEVQHGKR